MRENLIVGDRFEGVLLETMRGKGSSRPRVRPLEYFDQEIRVEFPRNLREENPLGTRFRADLKVSQKTKNGHPWGNPYLVATDSSIEKLDFKPKRTLKAINLHTASDRAYEYIEKEFKTEPTLINFSDFRDKAYEAANFSPETQKSEYNFTQRSDIIKTYALSRSNGKCESCDDDAPFLKRNGQPYLEVHHLIELGKGGSDSPKNVAAICPNCHARITHGKDAMEFNNRLKNKIIKLEEQLTE